MAFLKLAFICGAIPMVLGTAVFLTWVYTRAMGWERAWMWSIAIAIVFMLVGTISLLRYIREQRLTGKKGWVLPGLAAALLVVNVPVGGLYLAIVINLITRYTVEVQNQAAQTLDSFVVSGGGVGPIELGPVTRGQRVKKHFHLTLDGKLVFSVRQGAQQHTGVLEGSASPTSGGRKLFVMKADGTWQIITSRGLGGE